MFVVIVDWRVAPEDADTFAALLEGQAHTSLSREPACRVFDVAQDPEDPGSFFLYEVYDDRAAFDLHLETPHFAAFAKAADPMTLSKIVRTLTRIASGI